MQRTLTMKACHLFILFACLTVWACKSPESPTPKPEQMAHYEAYLEPVSDAVYHNDLVGGPIPPQFVQLDPYTYWFPCFNPADPYEIAYIRKGVNGLPRELFVFSFRTGEAHRVAANPFSFVDWSSKGWLIFPDPHGYVWKVRPDGDSLTQLTDQQQVPERVQWSPDGERFLYHRQLLDGQGRLLKMLPDSIRGYDWVDDTTLLGQHQDLDRGIIRYEISSQKIESLFPGESFLHIGYFDAVNRDIFVQPILKRWNYFLRFDLDLQRIDTLRTMYDTYSYGLGDYAPQTGHAIIQLIRKDWSNADSNEINLRRHLLLLDERGMS